MGGGDVEPSGTSAGGTSLAPAHRRRGGRVVDWPANAVPLDLPRAGGCRIVGPPIALGRLGGGRGAGRIADLVTRHRPQGALPAGGEILRPDDPFLRQPLRQAVRTRDRDRDPEPG